MQETYLILDLRNNEYASGLLTIEGERAKWYSSSILQVVKDWEADIRDSASAVPLSFFRSSQDSTWAPMEIDAETVQALDENGYEVIDSLFDEPKKRLEELLPHTLGPLLTSTFKEYSNISRRWMLLDNEDARDVLKKRFDKFIHQKNIHLSVPGEWGNLSGFALAFSGPDVQLPREGETWFCKFNDSIRRCIWGDGKFIVEDIPPSQSHTGDHNSHWKSPEELERVGAALLVLFWQDHLTKALDQRIDNLERQLEKDRHLLERLRSTYRRLSAENLVLSRQSA